jgi:hypothetical protein
MNKRVVSTGLAAVAAAAVAIGWTFAARSGPVADVGPTGSFLTLCVVVALITGVVITRSQPQRWTGPLVLLIAITAFAGEASQASNSASPVYAVVFLATILLPALLLVSQISGLKSRWLRLVLLGLIGVTAALAIPIVLAAHGRSGANPTWWNTVLVGHHAVRLPTRRQALPLAHALFVAHTAATVFALIAVTASLLVLLLRSDRATRRLVAPLTVAGLVWAAATASAQVARLSGAGWALGSSGRNVTAPATFLLQIVPLVAVASILASVAWLELAAPRLHRTTAGIAVRSASGSTDVTTYLAAALADPSVKVFFRRSGDIGWVDVAGRPGSPAVDDPDRGLTTLEQQGVAFGAIEYDASLASQPDAIELAVTAAAFALDSERLVALANARAEDARRLTARLVSSGDAARDELRSRLEAGPLRNLEQVENALALGGDLADAARQLQEIAADVRRISHGIFPAELNEGGLPAVLTRASEVPLARFEPAIEITAFLAADGDCGAHITAEPGKLVIALSEPPREPTLLERVAVLDGAIDGATIVLPVEG